MILSPSCETHNFTVREDSVVSGNVSVRTENTMSAKVSNSQTS